MNDLRPLLLLAAVTVLPAIAEEPPLTPAARIRGEVAALASDVEAAGGVGVAFVSTSSSLNFVPGRAWILTLWVEDAPAYGGAYFILSEVDGRRTGELLRAPGPDGTLELTGDDLARFLRRVDLDPAPIEAAFERYHRGARRGGRRRGPLRRGRTRGARARRPRAGARRRGAPGR
ncbi:MAG: hypothetical protein KF878_16070 [Planctomycetes bacterium]|nr:hypothetical protein [Planctomycetota bacterium]